MIDYKHYTKAALIEEIEQLENELDDKDLELNNQIDAYADLENKIDDIDRSEDIECIKENIEDVLKRAEDWDFGIKGWQKLETKQDLIEAIRKEIE